MDAALGLLYYVVSFFSFTALDQTQWRVVSNWEKNDYGYTFQAESKSILNGCDKNSTLHLPQVVHGVHELILDNNLVFKSGDSTFNKSSPFYYSPSIDCSMLAGQNLVWKVTTYSKFFARLNQPPKIDSKKSFSTFFDLQLNLISFSTLIFITLFSFVSFRGKISTDRLISTLGGGFLLSIYSLMTVNSYLFFDASMLTAHKAADLALSAGLLLYFYTYFKTKLINKYLYFSNIAIFSLGFIFIAFGQSGDVVQLGTTIQMPVVFLCLLSIAYRLYSSMNIRKNASSVIEFSSILFFIFAGLNDLMQIFGVINSYMVLPFGATVGVFFLAAAVNQDIEKTYIQRDDLVDNLKQKVAEQTKHLSEALEQVKKSQVDLVQSARLASLGTLSAGIAHEINNAINYVNGAVVPLERKVMKSIPESDRAITEKLFAAIKEGTHLTVEIVRSLRNFTGLNQAKVKDVNLKDTISSVLTILKSKLSRAQVDLNIADNLVLNCYQVGMNQIFMNLISNAIDVLPEVGGRISIDAQFVEGNEIELKVSDNGSGMSPEIKSRIFDAFYTTKGVGKGTGLGLHIVQKEVERHAGKITVESEINKGTTFTIKIPKNLEMNMIREAA